MSETTQRFGRSKNLITYCVLTVTEVQCSEADVARSLLFTISNDIGQIACLYAMMHQLNKVSFLIHLVYQDSDLF